MVSSCTSYGVHDDVSRDFCRAGPSWLDPVAASLRSTVWKAISPCPLSSYAVAQTGCTPHRVRCALERSLPGFPSSCSTVFVEVKVRGL